MQGTLGNSLELNAALILGHALKPLVVWVKRENRFGSLDYLLYLCGMFN